MKKSVEIPFDPETESIFCSRCGSKLYESGHMFTRFLLCPKHGEFTIAPIIVLKDAGWVMLTDEVIGSMWETCKVVDARHSDGSPYDPRETRVL